jgi:hypothetical protein
MAEQSFLPEHACEVRSNTVQGQQHLRRCRDGVLCCRHEQDVSLSFHDLDLFKKQIQPIELATDLSLHVVRQWTTIASLELFLHAGLGAAARIPRHPARTADPSLD